MTATNTLDAFTLLDAFSNDQDGAALMVAGMSGDERAAIIATLLGLLSAVLENPDDDPAEVLAAYLRAARRGALGPPGDAR